MNLKGRTVIVAQKGSVMITKNLIAKAQNKLQTLNIDLKCLSHIQSKE